MNEPFSEIFKEKNKVVHIFGTPGTYKTAFLVQIILQNLKRGLNQIYLIDVAGNFPYLKLESIRDILSNLIVFQPKSLREELDVLDDLDLNRVKKNTIVLIDDLFNRVNPENKEITHIESYILAIIKSISRTVKHPIFLTNEGRSYNDRIHPFRESLTNYYFDYHFHFEKIPKKNKIRINRLTDGNYSYFTELVIDESGLISELF